VKRNVGRPPVSPTKDSTTLTLRVSADFKRRLMFQADAVGMTLTEYLITLVERDGTETD